MIKKYFSLLAVFTAALIFFQACDNSSDPDDDSGRIRVLITDAPFPIGLVDEANVVIDRVEIRSNDTINGDKFITISTTERILNLVDLQNGLTATLADEPVPHGNYNLVRLYIKEASIKLTDGRVFDLDVPSGSSSGLKIFVKPSINVESNLTYDVVLDMDLSRSFVVKGNPDTPAGITGFNFKPVIRATNNTTAGTVEGKVTNELNENVENAFVWLEQNGDTLASSFSGSTGTYKMIGVPSGSYDIFIEMDTYVTQTATVNVIAGNLSRQDFVLIKE